MTTWQANPDGLTASVNLPNGGIQCSLLTAIPVTDMVLPYVESLATAQTQQIATINNACNAALAAITLPYPPEETLTWANQYAEAQAVTANPAASTPILSAIAAASGQTIAAVASSVLTKAAAYNATAGAAVGRRQALTAQIQAATTVLAVQTIVW